MNPHPKSNKVPCILAVGIPCGGCFALFILLMIIGIVHEASLTPAQRAQEQAQLAAEEKSRRQTEAEDVKRNLKKEADATKKAEDERKIETKKQAEEQKQARIAAEIASKPDLEVLDTKAKNEDYVAYITGTVRNNTDRTYSYVQVEINLYDKHQNQTGSTLANCNNLEPHSKWKFKAPVFETERGTYKIKSVTGF